MADPRLVHFVIDAKNSLFTVQAFASGIAAVVAHSPKFAIRSIDGHAQFVPESMKQASLEIAIEVASLELMDEVSKADHREIERIMFDEVLDRNRHPKVEFKSRMIDASKTGENTFRLSVMGDLKLRGTMRSILFESSTVIGEDTLRAQGAFSLQQSDYGILPASIAGGSIKIKDELKFSYFILARRQS